MGRGLVSAKVKLKFDGMKAKGALARKHPANIQEPPWVRGPRANTQTLNTYCLLPPRFAFGTESSGTQQGPRAGPKLYMGEGVGKESRELPPNAPLGIAPPLKTVYPTQT